MIDVGVFDAMSSSRRQHFHTDESYYETGALSAATQNTRTDERIPAPAQAGWRARLGDRVVALTVLGLLSVAWARSCPPEAVWAFRRDHWMVRTGRIAEVKIWEEAPTLLPPVEYVAAGCGVIAVAKQRVRCCWGSVIDSSSAATWNKGHR